uniref:Uncharacterized protein n=1 Tax=Romanomermis culicivorax TaxID=13658 RepID=A0A915IMB1_ROMCU
RSEGQLSDVPSPATYPSILQQNIVEHQPHTVLHNIPAAAAADFLATYYQHHYQHKQYQQQVNGSVAVSTKCYQPGGVAGDFFNQCTKHDKDFIYR